MPLDRADPSQLARWVGLAVGSIAAPLATADAAWSASNESPKRSALLESVHVQPALDPQSTERRIKLTIRDAEGRVLRALDRPDQPYTIEAEISGWSGFNASLSLDNRTIGGVQLSYQTAFLRARVPLQAAPSSGSYLVSLDLRSLDALAAPPRVSVPITASFGERLPHYDRSAIDVRVTLEMNDVGFVHPDDLLEFGPFEVDRALVRTILDAARETQTDPVLMMTIAEKESAFHPSIAASTSTASGLYQFLEQTWLSIIAHAGHEHGLAREAGQLAWDPFTDKFRVVAPHAGNAECGAALKAHFCDRFGVEAASRFLDAFEADPSQSAAELLPLTAERHPDLFYSTSKKKRRPRSVGAVYSKVLESISSKSELDRILRLRADPRLSALLATELWKRDCGRIAAAIGRPVTKPETYLCHFMGVNGATRFLKAYAEDPDQSAAKLMPAAAKANKPIYYERSKRKRRSRSVAEVYQHLIGMMTSRFERYRDVTAAAEAPVTKH